MTTFTALLKAAKLFHFLLFFPFLFYSETFSFSKHQRRTTNIFYFNRALRRSQLHDFLLKIEIEPFIIISTFLRFLSFFLLESNVYDLHDDYRYQSKNVYSFIK